MTTTSARPRGPSNWGDWGGRDPWVRLLARARAGDSARGFGRRSWSTRCSCSGISSSRRRSSGASRAARRRSKTVFSAALRPSRRSVRADPHQRDAAGRHADRRRRRRRLPAFRRSHRPSTRDWRRCSTPCRIPQHRRRHRVRATCTSRTTRVPDELKREIAGRTGIYHVRRR